MKTYPSEKVPVDLRQPPSALVINVSIQQLAQISRRCLESMADFMLKLANLTVLLKN